ncbi:LysE family translocator [Thiomicrorhabdus xiamenensis]|uniref:LysE family translocator n=1 Tax=Thiomicrorhabdus xiamenensis TaxID=2739063 RepID=A0A7D4NMI9_9GAMM|nr:LysE family translocator [Thiomicrorhabdus xiamenensis]QKI90054.1 LysE family translocator [Thiomicrorhabdus xiamenensis]
MLPPEILIPFIVASALLSIAPGPDNLYVLTQSALSGAKNGLIITLGLCTGLIVHTTLVAVGVAALIQASPAAFTVLKVIGALYLLYLAWQILSSPAARLSGSKTQSLTPFQLYRRGILMNISNPKILVFFLAFLPQFALPQNGPLMPQLFLLGALFIVVGFSIFSAIAFLSGRLGDWLKHSPRAQLYLHRIAGAVFIALAINLLAAQV